jgi:ribonucleoside-diphosphate reductase alpha chain
MELLEIVRQHAELLDRTIKYERDYAFDYFGFKAQIFFLFFPL